jgi:hypothetical protein
MLPLKKSTPDASAQALPAWHPDFRNYQRLPDTKVVRTSFLLNGAAVLVATVLLTWFSYQAYQWRALTVQLDQWQRQIERDKTPNNQALVVYKKFQAEASQVKEVGTFLGSRPVVSELLLHLGQTLPDYLALDRVDVTEKNLNLRGTVRGAPDQASGRASTYLLLLKADAFFAERFTDINLVNLNRNTETGSLILEINFKLREGKKS